MALEIRDIDNSSFRYRKTSRSFKDISLTFAKNPVTNDILPIKNEDAIKKSVMNLVKTRLGERFFNDLLGTRLEDSLFEVGTSSLIYSLESEIAILLENFEPRINNTKVFGEYQDESNDLLLRITYDIVGLPIPSQTIEFLLQPTRV